MKIEDIQLVRFRNYHNITFSPNKELNVFIGKNGEGKTNLLESMVYLIEGRSFRGGDRDAIAFGEENAFIRSRVSYRGNHSLREVKLSQDGRKILRIDGDESKNLREFQRESSCVLFSPSDLNLIKLSPGHRRQYLDQVVSGIFPGYDALLKDYRKVLEQRNGLLRREKTSPRKTLLEVYTTQLAGLAENILQLRLETLRSLVPKGKEIYHRLSGEKEKLHISYHSTLPKPEETGNNREKILRGYEKAMDEDWEKGTTTIGPHRDDLHFYINEKEAKHFGSQGQQRTAILAMKLGEIPLVGERKNHAPVLLLDDVYSELDRDRKHRLTEEIATCQCFITMTDSVDLRELKLREKNLYTITQNRVEEGFFPG